LSGPRNPISESLHELKASRLSENDLTAGGLFVELAY
jgi:hypothetical protein